MSRRARKFELELTHPGDRTQQTVQRVTETGDLYALTVSSITAITKKGNAFARIYARLGGNSPEHAQGSFINDYVYTSHFAHWTGRFPLAESSEIVMDIWSDTAGRFRLTGVIEIEP